MPSGTFLERADLDITDRTAVAETVVTSRASVVVNAAAYTKVDAAEADPEGARKVNVEGTKNLADACEGVGALFVYPSTDYVFDGRKRSPYLEDDPVGPLSVYGKTKLDGERAASFCRNHLIVRTSWIFGDGQNFIKAIVKAGRSSPVLDVVDDQWGLPTYAADLAVAILALIDKGVRGVFHLAGGGEPANWAGLAQTALRAAGLATEVRPVSTPEYYSGKSGPIGPRPAYSVLDCSKAASLGVSLRAWPKAVAQYVKEAL